VTIQSHSSGPKTRVPIGRLFAKVFLWFWLTVLALFAIFMASRMVGIRVIPPTDIVASFAPRVADEAAHAYESGGPQEFGHFAQGLVGKSGVELYLIDGYGKDVLSRPIPSDSLSIVRAARSGHPAQIGLAVRASYTTAAINSPAQVIPRTHAADRTLPKSSAKIFPPWMQSVLLDPVPNRPT